MPGTGEGNQPGLPAGKPTGISLPGGFPDASALCPLVVDFTTFGLIRYCRKIFFGGEWGGYRCNMVTFTPVGECVLEDPGTVHGTLNTHRPRGLHPRPSVPTGRAPQGASGTRGPGKVDLSGTSGRPGPPARDPGGLHTDVHALRIPRPGLGFGKRRDAPGVPRCLRLSDFPAAAAAGAQRTGFASSDLPECHERGCRRPSLAHLGSSSPVSCHQMAKSRDSPSSLAGPLCVRLFQTQQEVWDSLLALTQKGRFSETRWLMRFC